MVASHGGIGQVQDSSHLVTDPGSSPEDTKQWVLTESNIRRDDKPVGFLKEGLGSIEVGRGPGAGSVPRVALASASAVAPG